MHPSAPAPRILVIDDEPQIRRLLDISLRAQGYAVALAATGQEGIEALASKGADLVVLDLGLPDRDGKEVLRDLRRWSSVPVILLTVRSDETEKVSGLDGGANDYVTKPFGVQEVMARIRALLRAHAASPEAPLAVYDDGFLRVDLARHDVIVGGVPAILARKEFALLSLLMRHPDRVVTQPQILRELWGATHEQDTHYLRILVAKLRNKLHEDAAHVRYIATEPGVGYRFLPHPRP